MVLFDDRTALSYEDYISSSHKRYNYRIAIPSYQRSKTLREKSLKLLKAYGVSTDLIDIFVADEGQKKAYERDLGRDEYNIIVGIKGMKNVRNFMVDYYGQGQRVVFMDDDLVELYKVVGIEKNKLQKRQIDRLGEFFDYGFNVAEELKAGLWGIYPVNNPFFMSRNIRVGLSYIEGGFYGMIINHDPYLKVHIDDKEDFERSLRSYLYYGRNVRLNYFGMMTKFYTEPGGMQVERTKATIKEGVDYMLRTFPSLVERNAQRKKHEEIKLVERREAYKANNYNVALL